MHGTDNRQARLLGFIERIERLEEEKRAIADDIRSVKAEARTAGFDMQVIGVMLRERRMGEAERLEFLALAETYRAALGMLGDTPLGEYARKRLSKKPDEPEPPGEPEPGSPPAPGTDAPPRRPRAAPAPDPEAARREGGAAALAGRRVIDNPHAYGSPCRAAWDEGFCAAVGSDGMEIPEAWRRTKKKPEGAPHAG